MAFNFFLVTSDPPASFVDGTVERVLRAVLGLLAGREVFVVVLSAGLAGLPVPTLLLAGLLSAFVLDINVDPRVAEDAADGSAGRAGDLVVGVLDKAIRFAAEFAEDFEVSSEPLTSPFLLPSTELIEDLGLWPTRGALVAVTFVVGRRTPDVDMGRVGGLLSPLAGSFREIEDVVGLVAVLG